MTLPYLSSLSTLELLWLGIGFLGQFIFFSRFVLQWFVSEKQQKSVIPIEFWYLSIIGSVFLCAYAIYRKDIVFTLGFSLNLLVYIRNVMLINKNKPPNKL